MAMIAPTFCDDIMLVATTSSSIDSSADSGAAKYRKKGARPRCASARRMSDWNSTMNANTT